MKFKITKIDGEHFFDTCESWELLISDYLGTDLSGIASIEEVKSFEFLAKFMSNGVCIHEVVVESENFAQAEKDAIRTTSNLFMAKGDLVSIEKIKK